MHLFPSRVPHGPNVFLAKLQILTVMWCSEVDSTYFVLTVDLWNSDMSHEVNLVRHNTGTPTVSISTSTTTSYPPPLERSAVYMPTGPMHMTHIPPGYAPNPMHPQVHGYPSSAGQPMQSYYPHHPPAQMSPGGYGYPQAPHQGAYMAMAPATSQPAGMFTRNLIGSLSVNAFRLTDTEGKVGFWFVLQDLSVRTEGQFR